MDKIKRPITIVYSIVMIISVILAGWFYYTIGQDNQENLMSATDIFLRYTYFLFLLAAVSAIFFSFANIFKSAKTAKRSLVGIGGFIVLFGLTFTISSNEIPKFLGSEKFFSYPEVQKETYNQFIAEGATVQDAEIASQEAVISEGKSFARTIDSGLKLTYIVFLVAICVMVYTEIRAAIVN